MCGKFSDTEVLRDYTGAVISDLAETCPVRLIFSEDLITGLITILLEQTLLCCVEMSPKLQ